MSQQQIWQTRLTDVSTTDREGVGNIRWEGGSAYKYLRLRNTTATVAMVAGDVAAYGAATGYSGNLCVSDLTDADASPIGAGVAMAAIAGVLATDYYAWFQLKGPRTVAQALGGSAADGDELCINATDLTLERVDYSGTTPNIVANSPTVAYANDASAREVICDFPF